MGQANVNANRPVWARFGGVTRPKPALIRRLPDPCSESLAAPKRDSRSFPAPRHGRSPIRATKLPRHWTDLPVEPICRRVGTPFELNSAFQKHRSPLYA